MISSSDIVDADLEHICEELEHELAQLEGCKLLITGGAGFLGYYLVETILHWNYRRKHSANIHVTVYDNFVRGRPRWLKRLDGNKNLTLATHDITKPLPADIDDYQYIIHAASIASPTFYKMYPIETMDANVNGLRALLEYSRCQKEKGKEIKGFLFFSSSEIYGDPPPEFVPTPETYWGNVSCTGPRACYDESKRYGETLCVNFAEQYGLPVKVVRPFNNYGPGLKSNDRRVIADFARDILAGRDIVMHSDGSPTRTFCYVADAIVGYYKVLINGRCGHAYNIGVDAPEISILEVAQTVAHVASKQLDWQGEVIHQASQDQGYLVDNPNRRCPVITKARTELGFNPSVTLEEGIRRSLIWYRGTDDGDDTL